MNGEPTVLPSDTSSAFTHVMSQAEMLLHNAGQQHLDPLHHWLPITVALLAAMAFAWTLGAHSAQPADTPERLEAADTHAQVCAS